MLSSFFKIAINEVPIAQAAKDVALEDGQSVADLVIDAQTKLGEMLAVMPKPKFNKRLNGSKERTTEKTLPKNITKKESHFAQTIVKNPIMVPLLPTMPFQRSFKFRPLRRS